MCITISSSTSKRWGRDEPPKCSTVKKKHDCKVDDFLSNWRTWVISHPTKMEVQKWLKPRCFHLSPTPNPWLLPSAQSHHFCGWSNDLRLGVITFIHFNITKFSNSERIVSVSRVVEAAMSLLTQKCVTWWQDSCRVDWWLLPKVWKICPPRLPKDFLLLLWWEKNTRKF